MKRILLVTNDVIGDRCAGPGIRYIELGKRMARDYSVTLLGKTPQFRSEQPFAYYPLTIKNLIRFSLNSDCVIFRGGGPLTTLVLLLANNIRNTIVDLYAFTHFEVPHLLSRSFRERYVIKVRRIFHDVKLKLYSGYFQRFWVANERQADFLYGVLQLSENSGETEITVVPFGYPFAKPVKRRTVLRGVIDGIDEDDFILIWGGGVWDWLDPVTLIKAMARVRVVNKKIKLYFMGTKSPSGYMPEKGREIIQVSQSLGVLYRNVFINKGWIPYDERTDYLLEADVGISLHPMSLETRFSFRTRNLDYIYCGLPMIHTEGDVWAEVIERNRLGIVVPAGDDLRVSEAILKLYEDRTLLAEMRQNLNTISREYTWENIVEKAVHSIEKKVYRKNRGWLTFGVSISWRYLIFCLKSILALFK